MMIKIKTMYKTEAGTTWESENEAMIASVIENSSLYIEDYQLRRIVELLGRSLLVIPIVETEQEKEKEEKNETI